MMEVDFDQITPRTNTRSIKWECVDAGGSIAESGQLRPRQDARDPLDPEALLPLWLSDMDFPTPPTVREALIGRVQHGIFGYTKTDDAYHEAIINWMARRHDWTVEHDWIVTTSGVMQSINLIIQTLTKAGDGIIIQPPVFGPIADAVTNNGRVVRPNRLRYRSGRYDIDFADLEAKAAEPGSKMFMQFLTGLRNLNELFGVNTLGTLALQTAYETGEPWLAQLLPYLESNYLFLKVYLEEQLPQLRLVPAEGLYLAWIDCRALGLDEAGLIELFFDRARVYLEWGSHFGPEGEGFVRLNLACPQVILRTALERIKQALAV